MVVRVIATFVLCWLPYHAFCLLEVTAQYKTEIVDLVEVSLPYVTTFTFLNSVLNPIIYTFSCPNFCSRIRQSLGVLFEGLVEEAGPLVLVTGRMKKKDILSATLLSSPTPPRVPHIQHDSQGSINLFGFKSCPTDKIKRDVKM